MLCFGQIGRQGGLAPSGKAFMLQLYIYHIGMRAGAMRYLEGILELELVWNEGEFQNANTVSRKGRKVFPQRTQFKYKKMFVVATDYMINTKRFSLYLTCESVANILI